MIEENNKKEKSIYGHLLSANCLFCDLSSEALESLARIKNMIQFQKDVFIFTRGEIPSCVYILLEGQARMLSEDDKPLRLVKPDEIMGLTEMIGDLPCQVDVETITPCVCESINEEDFIAFLKDQPEVCFRLAQLLGLNVQKRYKTLCSPQN